MIEADYYYIRIVLFILVVMLFYERVRFFLVFNFFWSFVLFNYVQIANTKVNEFRVCAV